MDGRLPAPRLKCVLRLGQIAIMRTPCGRRAPPSRGPRIQESAEKDSAILLLSLGFMGSAFAIPDGHVCVIIVDVKGFSVCKLKRPRSAHEHEVREFHTRAGKGVRGR